ncbi:MAG: DUF981 family protein [Candidatus Saccharimonadales bacterium]
MIVYNEIIALTVGIGLIGTVLFGRMILRNRMPDSEGWAGFFGVTGAIMTALGLTTTVMWPYGGDGFEYANIQFGQPALAFGLLSLFWAIYLWRHRELFANKTAIGTKVMKAHVLRALKPVSLFVFAAGLMMATLAISWLRYTLGAAPEVEPISGLAHAYPILESLFLFGLWGLVAVGALLFPLAINRMNKNVLKTVYITWMVAGIVFLAFGAMNFYTHIGMYTNINHGTEYRI